MVDLRNFTDYEAMILLDGHAVEALIDRLSKCSESVFLYLYSLRF